MVPVPIPESYTVPQSYQPRHPDAMRPDSMRTAADPRPDPASRYDAAHWHTDAAPSPNSTRSTQTGPIPVAPPPQSASAPAAAHPTPDWNHYLAAGAFLAAGALLATGHRRLGIAAAAAGAATILLEDAEAVSVLCQQAPTYLAEAQSLVSQVQELLRGSFAAAVRR